MPVIKIAKSEWKAADGLLIIYGEGCDTGIAIPIAGLAHLAALGRRVTSAGQADKDRKSATSGWRQVHPSRADSFRVDTMITEEGEQVILFVDPNTDVEIPLSIRPDDARDVGQALIDAAGSVMAGKPIQN
jgi:hypothetical protein